MFLTLVYSRNAACGRPLLSMQYMEHRYTVDMHRVEAFYYSCSVWNLGIQSKYKVRKAFHIRAVYGTLIYSRYAACRWLIISVKCLEHWYTVDMQHAHYFFYSCSINGVYGTLEYSGCAACRRLLISVQCMEHLYTVDMQRYAFSIRVVYGTLIYSRYTACGMLFLFV